MKGKGENGRRKRIRGKKMREERNRGSVGETRKKIKEILGSGDGIKSKTREEFPRSCSIKILIVFMYVCDKCPYKHTNTLHIHTYIHTHLCVRVWVCIFIC